jgi:hypothetical protein
MSQSPRHSPAASRLFITRSHIARQPGSSLNQSLPEIIQGAPFAVAR